MYINVYAYWYLCVYVKYKNDKKYIYVHIYRDIHECIYIYINTTKVSMQALVIDHELMESAGDRDEEHEAGRIYDRQK